MDKSQRNIFIDALKGIAIIAVALYHFDAIFLPYGYLGVDVFFVISGYFLIQQLYNQINNGNFNYREFVIKKIIRLWPMIIIAAVASMILGFFLMLPDDYENLAETAIASSFFGENILESITTKNYWDVANQYKPLMHLWYIGVLMQTFFILPPIYCLSSKINKTNKKKVFLLATITISIVSLTLYLLPYFSTAWKFYYVPFRLFEITVGGLVSLLLPKVNKRTKQIGSLVTTLILVYLLCTKWEIISPTIMLLTTVGVTALFIFCTHGLEIEGWGNKVLTAIGIVGKCSYSIYICHQVIIAFLFYSFFPKKSLESFLIFIFATIFISTFLYQFIELPLGRVVKEKVKKWFVICLTIVISVALSVVSFMIYKNAGVVRDVPELDIYKGNAHRNMHAEYCDRPYAWDKEFDNDGKTKVLVIGNSFARDWANILYEYDKDKKMDISYLYYANDYSNEDLLKQIDRINDADYVFCSKINCLDSITVIPQDKWYIVGNKNYGESNGIIYAKRNTESYLHQTVELSQEFLNKNKADAKQYKEHYIDMMLPVMVDSNSAKVFTDDGKFISQDCRHLTQAGAKFYASVLELDWIIGQK